MRITAASPIYNHAGTVRCTKRTQLAQILPGLEATESFVIECDSCYFDVLMIIDVEANANEIGISVDAYKRLCRLFLEATAVDLSRLQAMVEAMQTDELSPMLHHIRGSALNMEFHRLVEQIDRLRDATSLGDHELARSHAAQLNSNFCELRMTLEALL